jgi:hypothetical protein
LRIQIPARDSRDDPVTDITPSQPVNWGNQNYNRAKKNVLHHSKSGSIWHIASNDFSWAEFQQRYI